MKKLRALLRLLYFALYTAVKIAQIMVLGALYGADPRRSVRLRQQWVRHIFWALGIHLHRAGTPPDFPCIVMGNHRSYLDPIAIIRDVNGYPVSKAEVENWPLIGFGAKQAAVLFLKRESATSRKRTLKSIAEKVREGWPVILFPEGTTHGHPKTSALRPGGFKLAVSENIPIVPVAVEYRTPEDYWVDDDTFLAHFFRRFAEPEMHVHIHYGPTLRSNDPDELLRETKAWLDEELVRIRSSLRSE